MDSVVTNDYSDFDMSKLPANMLKRFNKDYDLNLKEIKDGF